MQKIEQSVDNLLRIIAELEKDTVDPKGVKSLNEQGVFIEGQALDLAAWVAKKKRSNRIQVLPKTDITAGKGMVDILIKRLDMVGIPVGYSTILGLLILVLAHHYGPWILLVLACLAGLKKLWPRLWGR